jgi:hypothetical protein
MAQAKERRKSIRRTWGNWTHGQQGRVRVLFFFGLPKSSSPELIQVSFTQYMYINAYLIVLEKQG